MTEYGIALDIGTSGLRCQAIDMDTGETIATSITQRHPIPGMNVVDHVHFAIDSGRDVANKLLVKCANDLFKSLGIDLSKVRRVGVCGNTFQMSLFQNIEILDLAYAGENMLQKLGVQKIERNGAVVRASDIGLEGMPDAEVIIPPAVRHEIGADAIAMLLITGVVDSKEPCIIVDYGTNAEMALICGDGRIYTGSAAAGPAMEGQQIERGMLAAPGAISDIRITDDGWECTVLDEKMIPRRGDVVDPRTGNVVKRSNIRAVGITGTGTISAIDCGIKSGVLKVPNIDSGDEKIHLQDGVCLKVKDIQEAGKAIGAMRAGFLTLLSAAGMWVEDVELAYMSGASGLYVDAKKAVDIGMVVPGARRIVQFGNTSIEMARRLALGTVTLDELRIFAERLRAEHCMFATMSTFTDLYSIEYSIWMNGMPTDRYNEMLEMYGYSPLNIFEGELDITRKSMTDLPDADKVPVKVIETGTFLKGAIKDCIGCQQCVRRCPEKALNIDWEGTERVGLVRTDLCGGTACRKCEAACPNRVLHLDGFSLMM